MEAPFFLTDYSNVPQELRFAVAEIAADRAELFGADRCRSLHFEHSGKQGKSGYQLQVDSDRVHIRYHSIVGALRGLATVAGRLAADKHHLTEDEESDFTMVGVMFDLSRNGVLHVDSFKALIRRVALIGVNTIFLYCEDTYEVPGEPFFGYLRGAYSHSELAELDDYAAAFGIEMIPCIQTLGHLEQILKWPAYSALADTNSVLLAEDPATYALIEKLIDAATAPFRTKRIHVGMDEAWGIGSGRFKQLHGEKNRFEILNTHLAVVREMCLKRGLKPMIWSDMYFRIGSPTGGYYDPETVISEEVIAQIPQQVQLVYWDYYHSDPDFYEDWIQRHRKLGSEPIVALGVWTWNVHWAALPFSSAATTAGMQSCRKCGIREVFTTMWGDDGMECDLHSSLPGIQEFAEYAFHSTIDSAALSARFWGATGNVYSDWVAAAAVDCLPGGKTQPRRPSNASKWLLWNDPVLSHLRPEVDFCDPAKHYASTAATIRASISRNRDQLSLERVGQLAAVLAAKVDLSRQVAAAYRSGDRDKLKLFADTTIPALTEEIETLWSLHRDVWHRDFKPFGWETIEGRYGAILLRTRTFAQRIRSYLDGGIRQLPELEVEFLKLNPNEDQMLYMGTASAKSPSSIR